MATKQPAIPVKKPIRFGTDGWRGRLGRDFTFKNVRTVAQAIASFLQTPKSQMPVKLAYKPGSPVFIGYDRRFRSDVFAGEIAQILADNKLNPILMAEPLPTPALSFLTDKHKTLGVMVTASHNPADYNGIKIKVEGAAAPPALTEAVEKHLGGAPLTGDGKVPVKSFKQAYLGFLKAKAPVAKVAKGLKRTIVVDTMHGAGSGLMEQLLPPKRIVALHDRHDPTFGGLHPEPIEANLGPLIAAVKKEKALVGLAFDGDADRLGVVDDKGTYLTPCQVFPLLLEYLITHRKIKGKIVQSLSLGYLTERVAKAHGLEFEEVGVGFKFIAEKMKAGAAAFGGEESGGYAWKGTLPERDGLMSGLTLLEMLIATKKTPSQLLAELEKKYGKSVYRRVDLVAAKPVVKDVFIEKVRKRIPTKVGSVKIADVQTYDGVKVVLENGNWLLMRPSGTEPLIRTYAESDSEKTTALLLEQTKKWMRTYLKS